MTAWCAAATVLALALLPALAAGDAEQGPVWIVDSDETLKDGHREIFGSLVVRNRATLTLSGFELAVGGVLRIELGSTVRLEPSGGRPSTLLPASGADGFWVDVKGLLVSEGEPRSQILGLDGDGLESFVTGRGGIQVHGRASLGDISVSDGKAGIVVNQGAKLAMMRGSVERLGHFGIGVHGEAVLEDVAVSAHQHWAVNGFETCDIQMSGSRIVSPSIGLLLNSCNAVLESTEIHGSGIAATGNAKLSIRNSIVSDYALEGLSASPIKGRAPPEADLLNVRFVPRPGAENGINFLSGGALTLDGVFLADHVRYGVMTVSTVVDVRDSTIQRNGQHGILAAGGDLNLAIETMDFGSREEGTLNAAGAVRFVPMLRAYGRIDGETVPGLELEIFGRDTAEPLFQGEADASGVIMATFPVYEEGVGGLEYLGPFTYRASFGGLDGEPLVGTLDRLDQTLVLRPDQAQGEPAGQPSSWLGAAVLALLGFLLVGWHFGGRRLLRKIRRTP